MEPTPERKAPHGRPRRADLLFCLAAVAVLALAAGLTALAAGRLCLPDPALGSRNALPVYTSLNQIVEDEPTFAAWQGYDPADPPPLLADQDPAWAELALVDLLEVFNGSAFWEGLGFAYQPSPGGDPLPLRGQVIEGQEPNVYLYQYPLEHGLYQIGEESSALVPCLLDLAVTSFSCSFRFTPTGLPAATQAQAGAAQARVQADLLELLATGGGPYAQIAYWLNWYPLLETSEAAAENWAALGRDEALLREKLAGNVPDSELLNTLADVYSLSLQVLQMPDTILVLLSPYDEQVFGFYYDMRLQAYTGFAFQ